MRYAIGIVNDDATPERTCAAVGFCPAPEGAAFAPSPAMRATLTRATRADEPDGTEAKPTHGAADCLKCKFGVEALHEAVTSNDTVAALLLKADDACEKYAASFDLAATCEAAVATYAPEIVQKATAFLADAEKVCAHIGMCPPPDAATLAAGAAAPSPRLRDPTSARFAAIRETVLRRTRKGVADGTRGGVAA